MTLIKWRDRDTGQDYQKEESDELIAVQLWGTLQRSANLEPVSITPEPDWSRYRNG
jgi:hypothetical protein